MNLEWNRGSLREARGAKLPGEGVREHGPHGFHDIEGMNAVLVRSLI